MIWSFDAPGGWKVLEKIFFIDTQNNIHKIWMILILHINFIFHKERKDKFRLAPFLHDTLSK